MSQPHYAYMQHTKIPSVDRRQTFREEYRCGSCSGLVSATHRFCPWCGRAFWIPGVTTQ